MQGEAAGDGSDEPRAAAERSRGQAREDDPAAGWSEDVFIRWHENAVFYVLAVDLFQDSDGDGVGDLEGLRQRLDYLAGLGVDCIWLQPIHPSPFRDAGYDVVDHYAVDPRYGNLGDLVNLLDAAGRRGLRVMLDLVVNHTSVDHPWFQAARRDPGSPFRDYYLWRDEPPEEPERSPAFPGEQPGVWSYDEVAGRYYLHRFWQHQPDLNIRNPEVRRDILRIMRFWLRLGISGFRVDAVHFLGQKADGADLLERGHDFLRQMRQLVDVYGDRAILLAESDVGAGQYPTYFGDPVAGQMHLLFNFVMNARLFLALADGSARPLREALRELPRPPVGATYVNWLRNHDELNLERLDEEERRRVVEAFSSGPDDVVYGRGLRRRFPPMVDGDRRRIELAYSLVFALPGIPMLRYGEEIGMGDDPSLEGRDAVRTTMQWSDQRHGGFSTTDADAPRRPVISDGPYGFEEVNVADQLRTSGSLLNWVSRLVRTRKIAWPDGAGAMSYEVIDHDEAHEVLSIHYPGTAKSLLVTHNLGPEARTVEIPNLGAVGELVELFADQRYDRPTRSDDGETATLGVGPYGYRWLQAHHLPTGTR